MKLTLKISMGKDPVNSLSKLLVIFFACLLFIIPTFSFAQSKNLALNKPVVANSENRSFQAAKAVDGKITRNSKWMSGNVRPPHILEIDLKKYCDIDGIVVHTGIPEAEQTAFEANQASGFWSAKNFKLQYWDDANWTDIPNTEVHENRKNTVVYSFPSLINSFKLRFVCDDGEPVSIVEIEVFGKETDREVAGSTASLEQKKDRHNNQEVTITIANKVIGKSMKYVGYNQGYYLPGSNVSGWIEYSGVNSLRVWTSLNSYVPLNAVQIDEKVTSVNEFDQRKAEIRLNPEKNRFIKWDKLLPLYGNTEKAVNTNPMVLSYVLSELKRLKIDPLLQINNTDFKDGWSNKWQQWQRYYALAFYAAKTGDVTMFAMQNEPNHKASGPMELDQWIGGMQIVSDALKCAIEDVNRIYGKKLKARMVGPVTAGNNPEWWTKISKNLRNDYHGNPIDEDLLDIFSTHSYNSPAAGYQTRVSDIRKIIQDNHPLGKTLPIVYTEIGRWMNAYLIDKEETMDTPSLFTEWAGIYSNNTLNGGYGMWAFKFSNTVSETYTSGVKSGHHFTWQGKRIVEDAYENLLKNKPISASHNNSEAKLIVDGDKSGQSTWHSDSTAIQKWIEIDLGAEKTLGSAVIYTGSSSGTYTAPDRVRNFSLQYLSNGNWIDIPGFAEKGNKYAQVFRTFKQPVTTSKIRFVSDDPGVVKVREIKVFAQGDGPSDDERNYDISGIQRTGEVVRLFAKGFKEERPLYETSSTLKDENLDAMTSYDEISGNYYIWLVQRGDYKDKLTVDLTALEISSGAPVIAEMVSPDYYGEVTQRVNLSENKNILLTLPPQTVTLVTIPKGDFKKVTIPLSAATTVMGGEKSSENFSKNHLSVQLDAAQPEKNKVTYLYFDASPIHSGKIQRAILNLNGYVNTGALPFRLHVYGIPSEKWDSRKLTWNNAPLLDRKDALIKEVGQKAFVAGEIAFTGRSQNHMLDVTDLIKKHVEKGVTFVLIRETRQLGDDADKGREVVIQSTDEAKKSGLDIWYRKIPE